MNVFSSARARRRLLWLGAAAAVAAAIATIVLLLPGKAPRIGSDKLSSQPAVVDSGPAPRKLTRADRRAIDATLDGFVRHAVRRKDVGASYDLVTDSLRGGISRDEWGGGSIPVYPYPAKGATFHHWTLDYSDEDGAGVELMLEPRRGAKVGPVVFDVDLKRAGDRWLVDEFTPAAAFAPTGKKAAVTATPDFTPRNAPTGGDKARLNPLYAYIPFAVFGLLLAGIAAWAITRRVRAHRVMRDQRPKQLPPLPGAR